MRIVRVIVAIATLLGGCASQSAYAQQWPPLTMQDSPSMTIAGATADSSAGVSTGAHEALVQMNIGTVSGSYSTCTMQAKTSLDGTNYLTLGPPVAVTISGSTNQAWTVTETASGSASTSAAPGFGARTKWTLACASYGTSAAVTMTVIYYAAGPGAALDPCSYLPKTTVPISQTGSTKLISAVTGKKNFICSIVVVVAAAEIVNLVEGTGSVCGSSTAALAGSTTAASGLSFAANGGFSSIGGVGTAIPGISANVDGCLTQSGSNRVSGWLTYVQAVP